MHEIYEPSILLKESDEKEEADDRRDGIKEWRSGLKTLSVLGRSTNRKHFMFNKEVQKENVIKLNLFTSTTKNRENWCVT